MQLDEQPLDSSIGNKTSDSLKTANTHTSQKKGPMEDRSNTSHLKDNIQPFAHKSTYPAPTFTPATSDERVLPKIIPPTRVDKEPLHTRLEITPPAEVASGTQVQENANGRKDMDVDEEPMPGRPHTPVRQPAVITPPQTTVEPPPLIQPSHEALELPAPFLPPLAESPMIYTTELSEAERGMTVEEYIRYEMTRELERLRLDGQRTIENFRNHAAEVRARIEAL